MLSWKRSVWPVVSFTVPPVELFAVTPVALFALAFASPFDEADCAVVVGMFGGINGDVDIDDGEMFVVSIEGVGVGVASWTAKRNQLSLSVPSPKSVCAPGPPAA